MLAVLRVDPMLFSGVSGLMMLVAVAQRMRQPYYNEDLQHLEVVMYGVGFGHAVMVVGFGGVIPAHTYILVTIFLVMGFLFGSVKLQGYREQREH